MSLAESVAIAALGDAFHGFECIALACHGPPKDADGDVDEGEDDRGFEWKISEHLVIHDDKELLDAQNEVCACGFARACALVRT